MGPEATENLTTRQKHAVRGPAPVGHTDVVPDRPPWIRPVLLLLLVVGAGALVLAGGSWLAVQVLPDGDGGGGESGVEADAAVPVDLVEIGLAEPDDAVVQVDRCEVVDGVIEAGGRVQNTSGAPQAFLLQVAVLVDDRLFDGTITEVPVPTLADGEDRDWDVAVGAVDPDAPPVDPPLCQVDRTSLAGVLTD
jgi:hypothetical protein